MLARVSKSASYFVVTSALGLGGCASDGGVGELAMLGALGGSMIPGVDSGTVAALGAVAVTTMVVAPALSTDSSASQGSQVTPAAYSRSAAVSGPAAPITSAVSQPPTVGPWGSISESGYPQTSLAQWIAKETPEAYQGKSCEYLHIALIRSEQMLATQYDEPMAWGESKKKAIVSVLSKRKCPLQSPYLLGRLGAGISVIDTIKAPRLGMPSTGASVEKVIAGGPALVAGVQFADVITAVDGVAVADDVDVLVAINKVPTGSPVTLTLWRKAAYVKIPVVLGPPIETRVADLSGAAK